MKQPCARGNHAFAGELAWTFVIHCERATEVTHLLIERSLVYAGIQRRRATSVERSGGFFNAAKIFEQLVESHDLEGFFNEAFQPRKSNRTTRLFQP